MTSQCAALVGALIFFIPLISSAATACHTRTSESPLPPPGFGVPYDVLSPSRTLLLSAACDSAGADIALGSEREHQYVYKDAYEYVGTSTRTWRRVALTGTSTQGAWFRGRAAARLSRTPAELAQENFFVGYICSWEGNWRCGCRGNACRQSYWQLQGFKKGVSIVLHRETYALGEPIEVTIHNHLSQPIYVPADPNACSIVVVEHWQNGSWRPIEECSSSMAIETSNTVMPKNSSLTGRVGRADATHGWSSAAAKPASPGSFEGSLNKLPPAKRWEPGDPIKERTQSVSGEEVKTPPFSAVQEHLAPGTYRIAVTFSSGTSLKGIETSYSRSFVITDQANDRPK